MDPNWSCLICGSSSSDNGGSSSNWSAVRQLSKNLQVYFLLKKVLDLPSEVLEGYLHSNQDVSEIIVCTRCTVNYLGNCEAIFKELLEVERRFREARKQVVEAIRHQEPHQVTRWSIISLQVLDFVKTNDYNWTGSDLLLGGDLVGTEKLSRNHDERSISSNSCVVEVKEEIKVEVDPDTFSVGSPMLSPPSPPSRLPPKKQRYIRKKIPPTSTTVANSVPRKVFQCSKCVLKFDRKCHLQKHMRLHKSKESVENPSIARTPCSLCGTVFRCPRYMREHMILYHFKSSEDSTPRCELCKRSFNKMYMYRDHMASVHSVQKYRLHDCTVPSCGLSFWTPRSLGKHMTLCHKKIVAVVERGGRRDSPKRPKDRTIVLCPDCGKPVSGTTLKAHRKTHNPRKLFPCSQCSATFFRQSHLAHHLKWHQRLVTPQVKPSSGPTPCPTCSKMFMSHFHMVRHAKLRHQETPPAADVFKATCEFCNQRFRCVGKFKEHMASVHCIQKYRRYECTVPNCGRGFWSKLTLVNHKFIYHDSDKVQSRLKQHWKACPDCGKPVTMRNMSEHRETHKSLEEGPQFACHICEKMFQTGGDLRRHRSHEHHLKNKSAAPNVCVPPPPPKKCEECGISFEKYSTFYYHRSTKHGPAGGSRFACEFCGKAYHTKAELWRHQVDVHFMCKVAECREKFDGMEELWRHQLESHKDNVFVWRCELCGRFDTEKGKAKRHMRVHEAHKRKAEGVQGEEFVCDLCGKAFPLWDYLRYHISNTHKQPTKKKKEKSKNTNSEGTN